MSHKLFRSEALKNQYEKLWGEVNISQPLSYRLLSLLLILLVFTCAIFLLSVDYHKKQKVRGFLVPTKGVIKIYSPDQAYVSKVLVQEGQSIVAGQPILTLEHRHSTVSGTDLNTQLVNEIKKQLSIISTQKKEIISVYLNKKMDLIENISKINEQLKLIYYQKKMEVSRKEIAEKRFKNYQIIHEKGYLSESEEENQKDILLSLKQDISLLDSKISEFKSNKGTLNISLKRLPIEQESELQKLLMNESTKKSQLAQLEGERKQIIRASKSGVITSLNIKEGQLLKSQQYVVSILPIGSTLYVELMVPTNAFGFVSKGQITRIKLEAFPYQKFGMLKASIFETTNNILLPGEVELPIPYNEPIYRVKAKLNEQTIQANGKTIALQAGMLLDADILVEKRSLIGWLFEPMFSLKGILN